MALGLSRRATEMLEWLDVERGTDRQLSFDPIATVNLDLGDVSFFGPIQSRCQLFCHGPQPAQGAAAFSAVTVTAGPHGCWVSHFSTGGVAYRINFTVSALATPIAVNFAREDLAIPGLVPTVTEPFQFGEAQYNHAIGNDLPGGTQIQGGNTAAPVSGPLVANAIILFSDPVYIPPGQGITITAITVNTLADIQFRLVEALAFFGRNFGDRPGLST